MPRFDEQRGQWDGRAVVLAQAQTGCEVIGQATRDLIEFHKPSWLITAGFCTGLAEGLSRGTLVIADRVSNEQGDSISTGMSPDAFPDAARHGIQVGPVISSQLPLRNQQQREALAKRFPTAVADQEAYFVAEVCRDVKTRFMAIKLVTEERNDEWNPELARFEHQTSLAGKLGAAAGSLLKRPSTIKDLMKIKHDAMQASDQLAKFLAGIVKQLS